MLDVLNTIFLGLMVLIMMQISGSLIQIKDLLDDKLD